MGLNDDKNEGQNCFDVLLLNTVRHIGTLPYEDWRPGYQGPVGAQSPAFLNCNRRGGRVLLR